MVRLVAFLSEFQDQFHHSFNSLMVRLVVATKIFTASMITCFNSLMVRLVDLSVVRIPSANAEFQFLDGAIGSGQRFGNADCAE